MNRTQWLEERRKGIGGSDAASVMELYRYEEEGPDGKPERPYSYITTAFMTFLDKVGEQELEIPANFAMQVGTAMEPLILRTFEEQTGKRLLPKPEILRHPEFPYIQASLDGWTEDSIVEAKCCRWTPKWGEEGSDQIPLNYWMQVQHYLMVTGRERAELAALLYSSEGMNFRLYDILPDYEWHEACYQRYAEFWKCVEERIAPEPFDLNDLKHRFPKSIPLTRKEADSTILGNLRALKDLKERKEELEELEGPLRESVVRFIEDAEAISQDGKILATYKSTKRGTRVLSIKNF